MAKTSTPPKGSQFNQCPWCNFDNKDEKVAEIHGKTESIVEPTPGGRYQCHTCGKSWRKEALGQPWTIELERGPVWAREHRARELRGG